MIATKRVYDPPARDDGLRLLVMRLWPRGVRRDSVDAWHRDLAPSRDLLTAFRGGSVQWREFARRYRREMTTQVGQIEDLRRLARRRRLTLLCGCADESRCHRSLLRALLEEGAEATRRAESCGRRGA